MCLKKIVRLWADLPLFLRAFLDAIASLDLGYEIELLSHNHYDIFPSVTIVRDAIVSNRLLVLFLG